MSELPLSKTVDEISYYLDDLQVCARTALGLEGNLAHGHSLCENLVVGPAKSVIKTVQETQFLGVYLSTPESSDIQEVD